MLLLDKFMKKGCYEKVFFSCSAFLLIAKG